MRISHIQQRKVCDRVVGILRGFIAKINAHSGRAAVHRRSAFVEICVTEDKACLFTGFFRLVGVSAVEYFHFAHIEPAVFDILLCQRRGCRPRLAADQHTRCKQQRKNA